MHGLYFFYFYRYEDLLFSEDKYGLIYSCSTLGLTVQDEANLKIILSSPIREVNWQKNILRKYQIRSCTED